MKKKIFFLTIAILANCNIYAQITWENATTFTHSATVYDGISASYNNIFIQDNDASKIYLIDKGVISLLHSNQQGACGVGGVLYSYEVVTDRIRNLLDLSILHEDDNGISNCVARKGDTLVYHNSFGEWLKIGTADPVELNGISGTVKGYVIMNGHIFVYVFLSATTETKIWDFNVQDLQNPTVTTEAGSSTEIITFLDNFQFKYKMGVGAGYYFNDGNGWQLIDNTVFSGIIYGEAALSYYGENNDICLTCLKTSTGDLLQIYTAGLPSAENDILTFSFPEQTANAVINSTNHTVNVEVANGTNLTNLIASFTLSEGATAYIGETLQQSGVTQNDFTNSVIYTIHAENAETQTWTVNVTEEQLNDQNDILTFSFPEQTANAVINSTNKTVDIQVANGTILTNLVASFTLSAGATAYIGETEQQSGVTENDFTNSVIYTIQAENGETLTWTINVVVETSIQTTDNSQLSIYPNPTSGLLKIETAQTIKKVTISDLSGRIIKTTNRAEFDVSDLPNGQYFIQIETETGTTTHKILINK